MFSSCTLFLNQSTQPSVLVSHLISNPMHRSYLLRVHSNSNMQLRFQARNTNSAQIRKPHKTTTSKGKIQNHKNQKIRESVWATFTSTQRNRERVCSTRWSKFHRTTCWLWVYCRCCLIFCSTTSSKSTRLTTSKLKFKRTTACTKNWVWR